MNRPVLLRLAAALTAGGPRQPGFVTVAGRVLADADPLDDVVVTSCPTRPTRGKAAPIRRVN